MGRPVITTDAPGCRETVEDGRNGYLVPVRDSEALAQAMLRFIEQPELIERMGKESRMMAEEKFDVHQINAVMLQVMGIERRFKTDQAHLDLSGSQNTASSVRSECTKSRTISK